MSTKKLDPKWNNYKYILRFIYILNEIKFIKTKNIGTCDVWDFYQLRQKMLFLPQILDATTKYFFVFEDTSLALKNRKITIFWN